MVVSATVSFGFLKGGGAGVYLGGGGLLIVLGIVALVLGWTLIGIILIILGLFGGGFGFYNSRRGS